MKPHTAVFKEKKLYQNQFSFYEYSTAGIFQYVITDQTV